VALSEERMEAILSGRLLPELEVVTLNQYLNGNYGRADSDEPAGAA
jgi:hypothetical protein